MWWFDVTSSGQWETGLAQVHGAAAVSEKLTLLWPNPTSMERLSAANIEAKQGFLRSALNNEHSRVLDSLLQPRFKLLEQFILPPPFLFF